MREKRLQWLLNRLDSTIHIELWYYHTLRTTWQSGQEKYYLFIWNMPVCSNITGAKDIWSSARKATARTTGLTRPHHCHLCTFFKTTAIHIVFSFHILACCYGDWSLSDTSWCVLRPTKTIKRISCQKKRKMHQLHRLAPAGHSVWKMEKSVKYERHD